MNYPKTFLEIGNAINSINSSGATKGIKDLGVSITSLSQKQQLAILTSQGLTKTQMGQALASAGLTKQQISQALATVSVDTAQKAATVSTWSWTAAFNGLKAAIAANPIGFLVVTVTTLVSVISIVNQKQNEMRMKALEVSNAMNSQISKIDELRLKLSDEATSRESLIELITSHNKKYGDEVSAIESVNEARKEAIRLLDEEAKNEARETIRQTGSAYQKAQDYFNKNVSYEAWLIGGDPRKAYEDLGAALDNYNSMIEQGIPLKAIQKSVQSDMTKEYKRLGNEIAENTNIIETYETALSILDDTYVGITKNIQEFLRLKQPDIASKLFDPKLVQKSVVEYSETILSEVEKLPDDIKNAIVKKTDEMTNQDWSTQIALKLGFKIDQIEDFKTAIDKALGQSQDNLDQGIHLPITIELSKNLNFDELAQMQRYISEAKDEFEAMARAESLSKIFTPDNEKFLQNVRSIQSEYNNSKISITDANEQIEKSATEAFGNSADVIETFLSIFKLVPPAVSSLADRPTKALNEFAEGAGKLQTVLDKLAKGEILDASEIDKLIEEFPELRDALIIDANGIPSLNDKIIQEVIGEMKASFERNIANEMSSVQAKIDKLRIELDLDGKSEAEIESLNKQIEDLTNKLITLSKLQGIDLLKILQSNTNTLKTYTEQIDDAQSAIKKLIDAQEEYNELGLILGHSM